VERQPPLGFSDHRSGRETGRILYPVLSRRSGGLSLGVDLFPDAKRCSFDCPYCEVFPFEGARPFEVPALVAALDDFAAAWTGESGPVRDISLSGNGEPTLSPFLEPALEACARARRVHPRALGGAKLVVITNSTGFTRPEIRGVLERFVREEGLEVWAKLDAGSEARFRAMSGTALDFAAVVAGIRAFAAAAPLVIQTMLCELDGEAPAAADLDDYARLLSAIASGGGRMTQVHLYTQARPAPAGRTGALGNAGLLAAAERIASALRPAAPGLIVRVFGQAGELAFPEGAPRPGNPGAGSLPGLDAAAGPKGGTS